MGSPFQVTIDCRDADRMSEFWSLALDYEIETPPLGYLSWADFLRANQVAMPSPGSVSAIVDPIGRGPRLVFMQAHGGRNGKLQLDLRLGDDARKEAKVSQLEAAGGVRVRRIDDGGDWWVVMADPEGNEFCVT